jgi:hypothetical protein
MRTCMLNAATFPRISLSIGKARGSTPVKASTWQPAWRNLATAASNSLASASGSDRTQSRSLPPAKMLTKSGRIAMAAGSWLETTSSSRLLRIARLA